MWLALGDCYEYMRNLDEALICFQRAIEVGDTYVRTRETRGGSRGS